jgi:hypothetical protein
MQTFTFQVLTTVDETEWFAPKDREIAYLSDDWTAERVAASAARDHYKVATDDKWRVLVWDGDRTLKTGEFYGPSAVADIYGDDYVPHLDPDYT